jgi:hypothetical protein
MTKRIRIHPLGPDEEDTVYCITDEQWKLFGLSKYDGQIRRVDVADLPENAFDRIQWEGEQESDAPISLLIITY